MHAAIVGIQDTARDNINAFDTCMSGNLDHINNLDSAWKSRWIPAEKWQYGNSSRRYQRREQARANWDTHDRLGSTAAQRKEDLQGNSRCSCMRTQLRTENLRPSASMASKLSTGSGRENR